MLSCDSLSWQTSSDRWASCIDGAPQTDSPADRLSISERLAATGQLSDRSPITGDLMQAATPNAMREALFSALEAIGSNDAAERDESLLFANGAYAGHRFRVGGLQAIWMLNKERIVVLNATGRPIREFTIAELLGKPPTEQAHDQQRRAA